MSLYLHKNLIFYRFPNKTFHVTRSSARRRMYDAITTATPSIITTKRRRRRSLPYKKVSIHHLLMDIVIVNVIIIFQIIQQAQGQQTCEIDGDTYDVGDIITTLTTRCGSVNDYPCYCNPNLSPPIECPYCGFATIYQTLICAKDNEVVKYIDENGISKSCNCEIPIPFTGEPIKTCQDIPIDEIYNDNNDDDSDSTTRTTTCTIDLPGGTTQVFEIGESLGDFLPTRCGSDYPCYCNPDVLPTQIECPYCGFPTRDGSLLCARNDETLTYRNTSDIEVSCSCQVPSPNNPITNCIAIEENSPPTNNPTSFIRRTNAPSTTGINVPIFPPTKTPTIAPTTSSPNRCQLELDDGNIIEFEKGESYGDYLATRCGSSSEFPCYCNPDASNQIACPYCAFVSSTGTLLCLKDEEKLEFEDNGTLQKCDCDIISDNDDNPLFADPKLTCDQIDITEHPSTNPTTTPTIAPTKRPTAVPTLSPTLLPISSNPGTSPTTSPVITASPSPEPSLVPTKMPTLVPTVTPTMRLTTTVPTIQLPPELFVGCALNIFGGILVYVLPGNSFGDLISPGVCGSTTEWPSICNPNLDGDTEYPYCIFESNDIEGNVVCAKDGEAITYVTADGSELTCSCLYVNYLIGPQYVCNPPTESPTIAPINILPTIPTIPPITTREPIVIIPPSAAGSVDDGLPSTERPPSGGKPFDSNNREPRPPPQGGGGGQQPSSPMGEEEEDDDVLSLSSQDEVQADDESSEASDTISFCCCNLLLFIITSIALVDLEFFR